MKKLYHLLSLFVVLSINNQLQAQCMASFGSMADSNNTVQFNVMSPQSSSVYTYRWNFGDGSPMDTGASVSHQYSTSGVYAVTLYIDTFGLQCGSVWDSVFVNYCGAYFSYQIGTNLDVSFTSNAFHSPNGIVYEWDFGDGTGITQKNPTHTYSSYGTYFVTHTVIDSLSQVSCSYTDSVVLAGGPMCNASYTVEKDSLNTFGVILYNSSSNEPSHLYHWDFGDGQTANGRTPNHQYQNFGNYFVCLTITDSTYNCVSTFCDTVGMDSLGNLNKTVGFSLQVIDPLITSIQENEKSQLEDISIYPNPAKHTLSINLSRIEKAVDLRITDISGKLVMSKTNVQTGTIQQLNIAALSNGFYFLSIENGNNRRVEKIIKTD